MQLVVKGTPRVGDMAMRYLLGQTYEQIGLEHHITGERVRQLLERAGLGRVKRLRWNDGRVYSSEHYKTVREWVASRPERERRRRAEDALAYLRWYVEEFGRPPTQKALWALITGRFLSWGAHDLAVWLAFGRPHRPQRRRVVALYRLAGVPGYVSRPRPPSRPRGQAGTGTVASVFVSARLRPDEAEQARRYAAQRGVTVSELIRSALLVAVAP